jgi:serine/threonine-protein kinase RsbW
MTAQKAHMQIHALRAEIPNACDFVLARAADAGVDEQGLHHCRLAVDEVCNNIIEHGYGGERADQMIDVFCAQEQRRFMVEIVDDSPPFDLLKHPAPDPLTELQHRAGGGWGVHIIRKVMDEVRYEYRDGRNHLTLVKTLPASGVTDDRSSHSVTVTLTAGKLDVIAPSGQIDSANSDQLERLLGESIAAGHKHLVLDMTHVDYISGKGLKMLVGAWTRAHDAKGDLVLAGLQPGLQEVFRSLGFDLIFTIYDSLDDVTAG